MSHLISFGRESKLSPLPLWHSAGCGTDIRLVSLKALSGAHSPAWPTLPSCSCPPLGASSGRPGEPLLLHFLQSAFLGRAQGFFRNKVLGAGGVGGVSVGPSVVSQCMVLECSREHPPSTHDVLLQHLGPGAGHTACPLWLVRDTDIQSGTDRSTGLVQAWGADGTQGNRQLGHGWGFRKGLMTHLN